MADIVQEIPTIIVWQHDSLWKYEMLLCILTCLPIDCGFFVSMHLAKTCTAFGFWQSVKTTLLFIAYVLCYFCFPAILMEICRSLYQRMDEYLEVTYAQKLSTYGF